MEKKSSKIKTEQGRPMEKKTVYDSSKLRRFISAYDKLGATLCRRFGAEGDAIGMYVGRLGAASNIPYRDELMIRLVRCREIKEKFTRGQISAADIPVSSEDITAILSLEKKICSGKDPVSLYERGVRVSRLRQYSRTALSVASALTITALAIALFFAIKY